ncbi:MAG: hypothetical protein PHS73_01020 [Candidatus Peribacteraceae bacterium]|nr:hypothetical protein [Candidatus Peribacteraceae bacterium]
MLKVQEAVATAKNTVAAQLSLVVPVVAFIVPLIVSGPQWLTGTIVNCLLFLAAVRLSGPASGLTIVLPSIGAVGHGMLFGPFTPFLLFFLPFIWVGNWLLVACFGFFRPYVFSPVAVIVSAGAKAAFLYGAALLMVHVGWVPALFLVSMGAVQFVTAVAGGLLALAILRTA